jgi:hypothetical protein
MNWSLVGPPLAGGALIGLAAAVLLVLTGRAAGVSGIVDGALRREPGEWGWKLAFLAGLVAGGVLLAWLSPERMPTSAPRGLPWMIAGGLLVGLGTRVGGGCTSGHGICGLGRASGRSAVATAVFMIAAMVTVFVLRVLG